MQNDAKWCNETADDLSHLTPAARAEFLARSSAARPYPGGLIFLVAAGTLALTLLGTGLDNLLGFGVAVFGFLLGGLIHVDFRLREIRDRLPPTHSKN